MEFHVPQTCRKFHDQSMYTWIFLFVSQVRSLASNSQVLRSTKKLFASKVNFLFAKGPPFFMRKYYGNDTERKERIVQLSVVSRTHFGLAYENQGRRRKSFICDLNFLCRCNAEFFRFLPLSGFPIRDPSEHFIRGTTSLFTRILHSESNQRNSALEERQSGPKGVH